MPSMRLATVAATPLLALTLSAGLAAAAPAASAAPRHSSSSAQDDYPYRTDTTQSADQWGFTRRQCVSFAAFRMAQRNHTVNNNTQHWGSALYWANAAQRMGYRVSTRAAVGTVAQWNANERSPFYSGNSSSPNGYLQAGEYGHVGYVRSVYRDGSVLVEQYNLGGTGQYSTVHVKAPRYLYL